MVERERAAEALRDQLVALRAELKDKESQLLRATDEAQRLRKALLDAEIDMQVRVSF